MKVITSQEWGLIVLDEVHVAPAQMFRNCVNLTHSRCKIGLTATLVREDNLIDDLYFLVGMKFTCYVFDVAYAICTQECVCVCVCAFVYVLLGVYLRTWYARRHSLWIEM